MITEYYTVTDCTLSALDFNVNKMLSQGWQPYGEFKILVDHNDNWIFYQTMVKHDVKPKCQHPFSSSFTHCVWCYAEIPSDKKECEHEWTPRIPNGNVSECSNCDELQIKIKTG